MRSVHLWIQFDHRAQEPCFKYYFVNFLWWYEYVHVDDYCLTFNLMYKGVFMEYICLLIENHEL